MILHQILMQILYKFNKERTVSAVFHLINGKRSGQTIQDVGIYQLHAYFGILQKFQRSQFDRAIEYLVEKNLLIVDETSYFQLTDAGLEYVKTLPPVQFDGWHYRGNEHIFFARLSLIIQSLSYQKEAIRSFSPIQKNEQVQQWVRQFLIAHQFQQNKLQQPLFNEMQQSLTTSGLETQSIEIIMDRLAGANVAGFTWQQIAMKWQEGELDCQLRYIAGLQQWCTYIHKEQQYYPLLAAVAQNIRVEMTLTSSAQQTIMLYKNGHNMEQICQLRRLKISTIEDHFVEYIMQDPTVNMNEFVSQEDQQKIVEAIEMYETKKLKVLKEVVPHLSYFQIRIVVARGGMLSGTT